MRSYSGKGKMQSFSGLSIFLEEKVFRIKKAKGSTKVTSILKSNEEIITNYKIISYEIGKDKKMVSLNNKQKTILKRGLRSLSAILISAAAAWVAGPDGLEVFGAQGQAVMVLLLAPVVQMIDKTCRFGSGEGENRDEPLLSLRAPVRRDSVDGPGEDTDDHTK